MVGHSLWGFSNYQIDYIRWVFRDCEALSLRMRMLFSNRNNAKLARTSRSSTRLSNRPKEKPRPPSGV